MLRSHVDAVDHLETCAFDRGEQLLPRSEAEMLREIGGDGRRGYRRRQWRLGDEIDVLAANRREHAVVRMDAQAERRELDSLAAPLVRADDAEQLSQRNH